MTLRCIASALAQDIGDVDVLVIGNGCVDGTLEQVRARYWNDSRVRVHAYAEMISLNALWNVALAYGFLQGLPYVLVVNNDIVMRPDTMRLLVQDGGLFVTGVSVGTIAEMEDHANAGSRSPHPCFSCFLIREECWHRVGGFDETFWVYCSDNDYHLRMHKQGLTAWQLDIPFYHETSSTLRLVDNATRDMLQAKADADRAYFKQKHGFVSGGYEYEAMFKKERVK